MRFANVQNSDEPSFGVRCRRMARAETAAGRVVYAVVVNSEKLREPQRRFTRRPDWQQGIAAHLRPSCSRRPPQVCIVIPVTRDRIQR